MGAKKEEVFAMYCNSCEDSLDRDGDRMVFNTKEEAESIARHYDWKDINGAWNCSNCIENGRSVINYRGK